MGGKPRPTGLLGRILRESQPRQTISNLPGFVAGQSLQGSLGDFRDVDVFAEPLASGLFSATEVAQFRRTLVTVFAQEVDDNDQPHIAFLVEATDPLFPVFLISPIQPGRLVPVCDSLEEFVDVFVHEAGLGPTERLTALDKRLVSLMRRKKFAEVLETTDGLADGYRAALKAEDALSGRAVRGLIGHCLNFCGLAARELGQLEQAIESFREAADVGADFEAHINLAETLCYQSGDYEQARKLARRPVLGNGLWFRKVKLDGFASAMLGDEKQATRCYRMLDEKYTGLEPSLIESARLELKKQRPARLAAEILEWLGVADDFEAKLPAARKFWNELEPGWKKQLRALLVTETGAAARDKAVKRKEEPTDAELAGMWSRKELTLHKDYEVASLEPLAELGELEKVTVSYWARPPEFFSPLAKLKRLKRLNCAGNRLGDLSFISTLRELTHLDATWNQLTTLSSLKSCCKLRELRVGRNQLVTLDPIADLAELRLLWCSSRPLASLAPLESLTNLENLLVRYHSLTSLSSFRALNSLRSLTLNACREGIANDQSRAATRLADPGAISSLTNLTSLELHFDPGFETQRRLPAAGDCDDGRLVASLTKLKTLKLQEAELRSLDVLSTMPELRSLQLHGGTLKDPSLAPLSQCLELSYLTLQGPHYTDLETLAALPALRGVGVGKEAVAKADLKRFAKTRPDIRISQH